MAGEDPLGFGSIRNVDQQQIQLPSYNPQQGPPQDDLQQFMNSLPQQPQMPQQQGFAGAAPQMQQPMRMPVPQMHRMDGGMTPDQQSFAGADPNAMLNAPAGAPTGMSATAGSVMEMPLSPPGRAPGAVPMQAIDPRQLPMNSRFLNYGANAALPGHDMHGNPLPYNNVQQVNTAENRALTIGGVGPDGTLTPPKPKSKVEQVARFAFGLTRPGRAMMQHDAQNTYANKTAQYNYLRDVVMAGMKAREDATNAWQGTADSRAKSANDFAGTEATWLKNATDNQTNVLKEDTASQGQRLTRDAARDTNATTQRGQELVAEVGRGKNANDANATRVVDEHNKRFDANTTDANAATAAHYKALQAEAQAKLVNDRQVQDYSRFQDQNKLRQEQEQQHMQQQQIVLDKQGQPHLVYGGIPASSPNQNGLVDAARALGDGLAKGSPWYNANTSAGRPAQITPNKYQQASAHFMQFSPEDQKRALPGFIQTYGRPPNGGQ